MGGGSSDKQVAAWNFYVSASANDYYELAWTADSTNVYLNAANAVPGVYPAVPSVIATMGAVGGSSGGTTTTDLQGIYTTPQNYTSSVTIANATNALMVGPTINLSGSIIVGSGSILTIIP